MSTPTEAPRPRAVLVGVQAGLLFASIVPALFVPGGWDSITWRFQIALAIFVLFQTMKVHFTGISLARASLIIHDTVGATAVVAPDELPRSRPWYALELAVRQPLALITLAPVTVRVARSMARVCVSTR